MTDGKDEPFFIAGFATVVKRQTGCKAGSPVGVGRADKTRVPVPLTV